MKSLNRFGWNAFFHSPQDRAEGLSPARVSSQERQLYHVITQHGELTARITGRLRHEARSPLDHPTVGDWVWVRPRPSEGSATIVKVARRRSLIARKAAGEKEIYGQALAANVDYALLVSALNKELNLRRIERYIAMIAESGASPVLILNKLDLLNDQELLDGLQSSLEDLFPELPIHPVSATDRQGLESLQRYTRDGETLVLLGSSGVGKSTLSNALLGAQVQETGAVRDSDDRGRHTTSRRELFALPNGGCLIDTPGLRELQLWEDSSAGVSRVFGDIEDLTERCRFRDCRHQHEPGCAINAALETEELDEGRYMNYQKLQREQAWLDRKVNLRKRQEQKRQHKQATKNFYKRLRNYEI